MNKKKKKKKEIFKRNLPCMVYILNKPGHLSYSSTNWFAYTGVGCRKKTTVFPLG